MVSSPKLRISLLLVLNVLTNLGRRILCVRVSASPVLFGYRDRAGFLCNSVSSFPASSICICFKAIVSSGVLPDFFLISRYASSCHRCRRLPAMRRARSRFHQPALTGDIQCCASCSAAISRMMPFASKPSARKAITCSQPPQCPVAFCPPRPQ